MPDFVLPFASQWTAIFAVDLLRYLLGAGGVALALLLARRWVAPLRIQARRATAADRRREIGLSVQTVAIFALNGTMVLLLNNAGVISISPASLGLALGIVEFCAIVIAHDAWFYWMHRGLHSRVMFRLAHHAHHRSRTPTSWAAYAFAPLEAVFEALFLPLFLLLAPMHAISVFLFLAHMILRNALGHSGHELMPAGFTRHWLGKWFTTTVHHDLHHSVGRHNFGLYFTWWDRLMGTEHPDYHARFDAVARPWLRRKPGQAGVFVPTVLAAVLAMGAAEPARAETVEGLWVTERMDAVIEVQTEARALSGRIRWLRDSSGVERASVGLQLFSNFLTGGNRWNGRIFNPENGRTYRATIRARGANWLEVRGCLGPICQTQMWRRLSSLLASLPKN